MSSDLVSDFVALQTLLSDFSRENEEFAELYQQAKPFVKRVNDALAAAAPYIKKVTESRKACVTLAHKLTVAQEPLTLPASHGCDEEDDDSLDVTEAHKAIGRRKNAIPMQRAILEAVSSNSHTKYDLMDVLEAEGYPRGQVSSRLSEMLHQQGTLKLVDDRVKLTSVGQDRLAKYRAQ